MTSSTKIAPPALPALGAPAPAFELPADDGQIYSLAGLAGHRVVLYFYPRDNTPGCTTQACDFRDHYPDFAARGVIVLGVSGDSLASHARFRAKHQLPFPLLADTDHRVARAYGSYGPKKMAGRDYEGIIRSTFVLDEAGRIAAVYSPVKVAGHAQAVLTALAALSLP